jgi:hypothetical protein
MSPATIGPILWVRVLLCALLDFHRLVDNQVHELVETANLSLYAHAQLLEEPNLHCRVLLEELEDEVDWRQEDFVATSSLAVRHICECVGCSVRRVLVFRSARVCSIDSRAFVVSLIVSVSEVLLLRASAPTWREKLCQDGCLPRRSFPYLNKVTKHLLFLSTTAIISPRNLEYTKRENPNVLMILSIKWEPMSMSMVTFIIETTITRLHVLS